VGPRASLDVLKKRQISFLCWDSKLGQYSSQLRRPVFCRGGQCACTCFCLYNSVTCGIKEVKIKIDNLRWIRQECVKCCKDAHF
jgi:hypothetical protein